MPHSNKISVRELYEPTPENSLKTNHTIRILLYQLITNSCPFISIVNLEGKFLGNIWLNGLSNQEFSENMEQTVGEYLEHNPEILEKNHLLSLNKEFDWDKFTHDKNLIYPVIDQNRTYKGHLNLQKLSFERYFSKLKIVSSDKLLHILIVEDEPDLLSSVCEWLSGSGYICNSASNGAMALEVLKKNPQIQLVLTDIKMPVMDGKDFIRQLRETDKKIPIIIFSGYSARKDVIDCLKMGANDFLDKPIELDILEHSIKQQEKNIVMDIRENCHLIAQSILGKAGLTLSDTNKDFNQKLSSLINHIADNISCENVSFIVRKREYWNIIASTHETIHDKQIESSKAPLLEHLLERPRVFITNSSEEISFLKPEMQFNHYRTNSAMIFPTYRNNEVYAFFCCSDKKSPWGFSKEDLYIAKSIISPLSYLIDYACIQNEVYYMNQDLEKTAKGMAMEILDLKKETEFQARLALLGEMAASIAHDIKNPLSIALGNIETIERNCVLEEKYQVKIKKSLKAMTNIAKIADSITRMAHKNFQSSSFDLKEAIETSLFMLDAKVKKNDIKIEADDFQNIQVKGNQIQIEQVITNLISNAIDAVKKQDERFVRVAVENESPEYISISIFDNGPGIPLEQENQVFNKWFTTKELGEGTGLGLHICKTIIESHMSELVYNRTDEKLSQFSFILYKNN